MRVPQTNLNELRGYEYEELKSLRVKDFDGVILAWIVGIVIHVPLSVFVASKTGESNWIDFLIPFLLFLLFPYCWIPAGGVALMIAGIYSHFSHKSKNYLRYEELRKKFSPVERDVQQALNKYIDYNLRNLVRKLRQSSSNPSGYQNLIADLQANHLFIEEAAELMGAKSFKTRYEKDLEKENVWFANNLPNIGEKKNETKINKLTATGENTGWLKKYRNKSNPISLKIETNRSPRPFTPEPTKPIEPEIRKPESQKRETPKSPRQSSLFDEPDMTTATPKRASKPRISKTARKTTEAKQEPSKIKTPRQGRVFQPSEDYYRKVADRKMEIGRRGELFVMEHEKQRLIVEEGADFLSRLEHSSVVRGDGLGYDVLSFDNEAEIYIEVKTTTGKFSANVFFTENEFNTMNRYADRYYLYRVYEFDQTSNTGQILIFKGKKMIESYFDFSPKVYVLTQKTE